MWRVARSAEQIRHSMDQDDGRGPGGFDRPGVSPDHPDLVAYWKFDEGSGYTVKDVTQRGHDLMMMEEPTWEVGLHFGHSCIGLTERHRKRMSPPRVPTLILCCTSYLPSTSRKLRLSNSFSNRKFRRPSIMCNQQPF